MLKESQRKVKGKSKESISKGNASQNFAGMRPKLFRVSTVPMSLNLLLKGQLSFLNAHFQVTAISGGGDELELVKAREGVAVHPVDMHRDISLFQDVISLWRLYRYFKREKPDIVHSITPKAGLLTMLAAQWAGVPVRMHTFTGLIFPHREGGMKRVLILMDRLLCRAATHVYPEGKGVEEDLIKHKITSKPLKIIAHGNINGVDLSYFDPGLFSSAQKISLREQWHISQDDFVFVYVGRLVPDKGLMELVASFECLSAKNPKLKLLLVGPRENAHRAQEKQLFAMIARNPHIIETGYQEDVRPFYALSDVFVLPSYREGFPNTVLQAGAMNLPSIVTDISGSNEIIEDSKNGLIVAPKNKEALEAAMYQLSTDADFTRRLSEPSREIIAQSFDQKIVWEALLEEYRRVLCKKYR